MGNSMLNKAFDNLRIPDDDNSYVYCLYKKGEVIYIGSTSNLRQRIAQHFCDDIKDFDDITFKQVNKDELCDIEAKEIVDNNPILNKNLPRNNLYISKSSAFTAIKESVSCWLDGQPNAYTDKSKKNSRFSGYITMDVLNRKLEQVSEFVEAGE
jgi:hypothetical protein